MIAVILAGGKSKRMGQDKALMRFSSTKETLLQKNYALLSSIAANVWISGRHYVNWPCFTDHVKSCGPLAGILSALKIFKNKNILVIPCDLPFLNKKLLDDLVNHHKTSHKDHIATICLTNKETMEPLVGLYTKKAEKVLEQAMLEEAYSLRSILSKASVNYYLCNQELSEQFFNMNTPTDAIKANLSID